MRARVVWSPRAIRRATEAALFIAAENPSAAVEWTRGLFESARPLAQFPELGKVVPEVGRVEVREIIFSGYRVVYRVAPRLVEVLTVRPGKRKFSFREVGVRKPRQGGRWPGRISLRPTLGSVGYRYWGASVGLWRRARQASADPLAIVPCVMVVV